MSLCSLSNIEKTFGKRVLFDRLNLTVYPGERIGFIGDNGSGKTTLFKVIMGQVVPDQGEVAIARGVKAGYLAQDPVFDPANSVIDEAELAFADLHRLSHELRELEHAMHDKQGDELGRILRDYQHTQHEFELAGGYAWRHRLEATLLGIGLPRESWEQDVTTLSGGQRSRLALAKLLISEPDLLLLDEPTNHLDLAAIEWLEDYLLSFKGAVVLISHDRFLLDRLVTRIAWLHDLHIDTFPGNYSAFVQQRQLIELSRQRAYEQQQEYIARQQEFVRRFQAGQRSKEARGRATRLERLMKSDEMIQKVSASRHIHLSINTDQRAGDQVLSIRELSKGYDSLCLWENVTLRVARAERIGIIGPNGSGKTTLLRVLLGEQDADAGEIKWGANLNIGYYDQRLDDFDPDNTIMDEVREGRDAREKQVRDVLAMMLFRGDDVFKPVGLLSGGERARVRLAQLLLDKPNVLLLDEPTNHLDIASREAVENALREFPGTLLCVSHDRYFLDKVARRLWVLRPPAVVDFPGNYSDWARRQHEDAQRRAAQAAEQEASARKQAKDASRTAPKPAPRKDNPYKRPFGLLTVEQLEKEIEKTEKALKDCQSAFADPAAFRDPVRGAGLQAEYESLTRKLEELESEYFLRE